MIKQAALIGGGVIGSGWAARLCLNGVTVRLYDPDTTTPQKVNYLLRHAEHAVAKLSAAPRPPPAPVQFVNSLADAVADAEWIIESAPERLAAKQKIYATIEATAPVDAIIASSTSGLRPSDLQAEMKHPQRFLVAHPFNPVYLLPLVEVVGGKKTTSETIARAMTFYKTLGMRPLYVKKEIDAFIADRLLEAVWRESLWLVHDNVATTQDIDDAICYGFGLRWAQMGIFETYRLAGGDAGMKHFLKQFGPALQWPWTKLTNVPPLNKTLIEKIAAQSDIQSGAITISALAQRRDDNLIAILQALKANQWSAGETLDAWEKQRKCTTYKKENVSHPLHTLSRRIPAHWTDFNGHMTESRYLECFSDATETLMHHIGADDNYIASGYSYFTAETHICHLSEVVADDEVIVETQVLNSVNKKLHLFHWLKNKNNDILATSEHLLIHVNLQTRLSCSPLPAVSSAIAKLVAVHAILPIPPEAGRAVSLS